MKNTQSTNSLPAVELRAVHDLQPHPEAAKLLPPLSGQDYRAFLADVRERGLLVPLEITEAGTILDGHLRFRAARDLGLEQVPARVVSPPDEVEHLFLNALQRRHLSQSQKAALAVELDSYRQQREQADERRRANLKGAATEVAALPPRGKSRDHAAALAGVSARTIQDAVTVQAADPGLFEQVKAGRLAVDRAASKVRRAQRDKTIAPAPPLPKGPFPLILADPPWSPPRPTPAPHPSSTTRPCASTS
jgi:ParB family chromosome partitioning protein